VARRNGEPCDGGTANRENSDKNEMQAIMFHIASNKANPFSGSSRAEASFFQVCRSTTG